MRKSLDKIRGALLGVAVGDALGAPLEFMSAEEIRQKHGTVREMIGGGWLNVAPGEITDDTQMTLAVAEGIAESPSDPIPAIGRRFIEWYDSQPKDIGNCCRAAIAHAKQIKAHNVEGWFTAASLTHEETHGQTAGNGALMRTIYPALFYQRVNTRVNEPSIGRVARYTAGAIGAMTHLHADSTLAILAYTEAVAEIIGVDEDIYRLPGVGTGYGKERIEWRMKRVRELTDESNLRPDGYVLNSLVCAINAIRDTSSFEDALVCAVNLGGDADTIGAITGGLAGALYGAREIPRRWTDALDEGIKRRIERLAKTAHRVKA
ncbi:MAG: ADP-ribosylglycohydrolase family protein [Clostridium sp.]|jgi:ADP-ribosyl-[dinitrogen reductase] hydrolase|nr:ADP-ribosylglycohydrolase family protein [Clostridium sp.]